MDPVELKYKKLERQLSNKFHKAGQTAYTKYKIHRECHDSLFTDDVNGRGRNGKPITLGIYIRDTDCPSDAKGSDIIAELKSQIEKQFNIPGIKVSFPAKPINQSSYKWTDRSDQTVVDTSLSSEKTYCALNIRLSSPE